jgi:hypothetical protein
MKTVYFIDDAGVLQSKINCKDDYSYSGENYTEVSLPKINLSDGEAFKFDRLNSSWSVVSFSLTEDELKNQSINELKKYTRAERNALLFESDWTQLPDVPEETRLKWQEYRQALRDITLQEGFPENIIWPTKPE